MLNFLKPSPTNVKKLPFIASEERVHLIIGYTASFVPVVLRGMNYTDFACFPASISHFYYIPIADDLFVGALVFIGMCMLFVYRVDGPRQFMTIDVVLTRIAGISAICVAIFPTRGVGCVFKRRNPAPLFVKCAGRVEFGSKHSYPDGATCPMRNNNAAIASCRRKRIHFAGLPPYRLNSEFGCDVPVLE